MPCRASIGLGILPAQAQYSFYVPLHGTSLCSLILYLMYVYFSIDFICLIANSNMKEGLLHVSTTCSSPF